MGMTALFTTAGGQHAGERGNVSGMAPPAAPSITVADSLDALVAAATAHIGALAARAIAARGRFRIALAGGSTPRALYPRLVGAVDWALTDVFFGDERAVPPDDPQSNYRMARETLLDPARVPAANVFRWRAESPDLDGAARDYERALRAGGGPPWLDLALLGLGPDGHTASLFPGTAALTVEDRLAVAVEVPAPRVRRLTLAYPTLLDASDVLFLVTGSEKRAALAEVLRPGSTLPAARVVQRPGRVTIFCDADAARDVPRSSYKRPS
jgi:6-phosphogluconolactonase